MTYRKNGKGPLKTRVAAFVVALSCAFSLAGCSATSGAAANSNAANSIAASSSVSQVAGSQTASSDAVGVSSTAESETGTVQAVSPADIPAYKSDAYVAVNGNEPYFTDSDYSTESFESYSELDSLGRCGVAYANIGKDLMPTEERGSIGSVKPSGWHTVKYDFVDGKYLYNRCHLIGYQLTGENANEKNLITGTRYLNIEGMLPFENMVADYIKETGNHVLYRVTPIFDGNNLVATGVLMEAKSAEDKGEGICYNVFCYNVQQGVMIDYATGESALSGETTSAASAAPVASAASEAPASTTAVQQAGAGDTQSQTYVLNTNTMKFHLPGCSAAAKISESNRQEFTGTRDELIAQGYSPCGICHP